MFIYDVVIGVINFVLHGEWGILLFSRRYEICGHHMFPCTTYFYWMDDIMQGLGAIEG